MSQAHCLVIDDDPVVRHVLQDTLMQQGGTVSVAADGMKGLQAAKGMPAHIVVTDLQLPAIDGISLIDRLAGIAAKIIPMLSEEFPTRSPLFPTPTATAAAAAKPAECPA